ncbi:Hsp20/alpha crystallin family protein [Rhodocaloribacter litoris]|uniref:Hsp20/alpha crystallin family protein n=1 Tax=Rhodocaloribacter litoris TaxID=2558931 RepID=UPI001423C870|nr:Hsp20/alpha crystallin family protein [Rhodocaloribacter litoris]QXD14272.1 Hsp20/alpha crystallin family protein [Rhodocaloribacter litoris]GIV60667.1 MAG: heat-shock protein [Rhodothermaceae bacterium]
MTNLTRFSPARDLRLLQREFDRLFDSFLSPARSEDTDAREAALWTPRVDLVETDDAYLIHMDLPGMSKEDLNINFHDGTLTVSGERKFETQEKDRNYVRVERQFGHFYRSFTLPKAVDEGKIGATYKDGVLEIRVPKAEEVKPRRIEVK